MKINEFIAEAKKKAVVSTKKPIGYEISDIGPGGTKKNTRSDDEWKKQKGSDLKESGKKRQSMKDALDKALDKPEKKLSAQEQENRKKENQERWAKNPHNPANKSEKVDEGVFGNMAGAVKGAVGAAKQGGIGKAFQGAKTGWTNASNTSQMKTAQKTQSKKVDTETQKRMASWARTVALVPQGQQPTQAILNQWWTKTFGGNAPRVNPTDNNAVSGAVRKAVQTKMAKQWAGPSQGGQPAAQPTQGGQPAALPTQGGQSSAQGGQQQQTQSAAFWQQQAPLMIPDLNAMTPDQMIGLSDELRRLASATPTTENIRSMKRMR